jgi:hypothetical protein
MLLPVVLAVLGEDFLITRNMIAVWVPAGVALAGVLAAGGRAGLGVLAGVCGVGLAVTLGVDLNARYQRDDWRGVARAVPAVGLSAIEVTPSSGRLALEYYLPGARPLGPAGASVASVEVIALGARGVGAAVQAPPLPDPLPVLAGFGPPVASTHATYTVLRYAAPSGTGLVTPAMLVALDPSATGATQLVTRPG